MTQNNPADETKTVQGLAQLPTLRMTPGDRAIGQLTKIALHEEPEGQAAADLASDVFQALYQRDPQLLEEAPAERGVNQALLKWVNDSHGWAAARESTRSNLPAAIQAAKLMWAHLRNDETIAEALKEQEKAEEKRRQAAEAQAQAKALNMAADAADAGGTGQGEELRKQARKAQSKADRAGRAAAAAAEAAGKKLEEAQGSAYKDAKVKAAARNVAKEAKETAEAAAGWGMGPGSSVQSDPAEALAFLEQNNRQIARIAELAGRLRGVATQARITRTPTGVAPVKVGLTQDLTRTFATELAMLHPAAPAHLRAEKAAEWAESGLMGYRTAGDANKRGSFVAAVDTSGSMRGARNLVAKAVALGLAQSAKSDGRPYILFAFSSGRPVTVVTSKDGWREHMTWAADMQSGGTDFDMAIRKAIELLDKGGEMDRADCLFISDGEAGVSDAVRREWEAFSKQHGARMLYVPVGYGGYTDIETTADKVLYVRELDAEAGTELARELGGLI